MTFLPGLNIGRKLLLFLLSASILIGAVSFIRFPNQIGNAESIIFGTDSENGDFIVRVEGIVRLRVTNQGVLTTTKIQADNIHPITATLWPDEFTTLSGSLTHTKDTNQMYGGFWESDGTDETAFEENFLLKSGSYIMHILGKSDNNNGKIDWYIDNSLVATGQDWYSSQNSNDVIKSEEITISDSGLHTLKGIVNGKNPNSSSYVVNLTKIWFN